MAVSKAKKVEDLAKLKDQFSRAKGVVFAKYSGMGVNDIQTLRRALRENNVDYKVAKKTLVTLAAKEHGIELPKDVMEGPIGVAFGYDDEIVAAQKMAEFAKKFLESIERICRHLEQRGGRFRPCDERLPRETSLIRELILSYFIRTL
ncbi:MAG: 50S ribosomal protein L10 [Candidatus Peregrinibacteria bacterium GW2011_GWA2_44_7]|nr:MAG: 50S ribosomal protein L10 [Candidatus Peregrinibacteria bacterium GW2011_GWA2_44_7]